MHLINKLNQDAIDLLISSLFKLYWGICEKFNALLINFLFSHSHESLDISHHRSLHRVVSKGISKDLVSIKLRILNSPKALELSLVINLGKVFPSLAV